MEDALIKLQYNLYYIRHWSLWLDLCILFKTIGVVFTTLYPAICNLPFGRLGYRMGDLPTTERVTDEIVSLPMYPELTAEQRVYVMDAIREFYKQGG